MGDFTWHTSDPDHTVIAIGSQASAGLEPFNRPVYLLGPDGQKWREDCYEGYDVFGTTMAGTELARWNFPAEEIEGLSDEELRLKAVSISLRPYGDEFTAAPKFPLKFSRNPDAVYDELPAAIPTTGMQKNYGITDFDVHLADGTVISGEKELQRFWCDHSRTLDRFAENMSTDEDQRWDWIMDVFWDEAHLLPLPEGARLVYVGYKSSLHLMVHDLQALTVRGYDNPMRWSRVMGEIVEKSGRDYAFDLADAFDAGVEQGWIDYDRLFAEQLQRYESGQPLSTEPMIALEDRFDPEWWSIQFQGVPTTKQVHQLGRRVGAYTRNWQVSQELTESEGVVNPIRRAMKSL